MPGSSQPKCSTFSTMSNRTLQLSSEIHNYLLSVGIRETAIQRRLREETASLREAGMQIAPEEGQLLALLVRLLSARNILEIGTFTGYSALSMALAQPPEGHLLTCDISREWTDIARRYWHEAGMGERIELRLGRAVDTLSSLQEKESLANHFDLAFIDADKQAYRDYYEHALALVRPGGLLVIDNTLWGGRVAKPGENDSDTLAIRELNHFLHTDERIDLCLVPIADGVTLAYKRYRA